jgi:hypothetical protein
MHFRGNCDLQREKPRLEIGKFLLATGNQKLETVGTQLGRRLMVGQVPLEHFV